MKMNKNGFIKYLEHKDFAAKTIKTYVKYTEQFFAKAQKEDIQVTKPDVLKFLEYLKNNRKVTNAYRSHYLVSLNHYFSFLYEDGNVIAGLTRKDNPCLFLKIRGTKRKMLYKIYTSEELDQLFDNYYGFFVRGYDDSRIPNPHRQYTALSNARNALILSVLIYQGAKTGDIEKIETGDIDLIKATLKMRGGKQGNDRILPLKATQIGLFINYLQNIRPQISEYLTKENNKLFLSLPNVSHREKDKDGLRNTFTRIAAQLKIIDKQFINVLQIRASVITFWIKTQGLRKAQYLAGHRHISGTEKYLPNNLDDLKEDINKLHPF